MNLRIRTLLQLSCSALTVLFGAGSALAATPVNHGTYNGSTVDFVDVTETTQDAVDPSDPLVLFGAPVVSGDELSFNPTAFTASASGAGDLDQTLSLLQVEIVTTALGASIDTLKLQEFGDSILAGPAGTGATGTFLSVSGTITVMEAGGVDIPDVNIPINGVFAPTDTFDIVNHPGTVNWQGVALIDIASVVPNATRVFVAMNNYLVASSEGALNAATIQKKADRGVVITVPEPGTLAFLGLGLLGALVGGRRRS